MLYTQYKDAALKHLQACKTALHGLSGTVSTTNKDALLLDIFYLSGYTLECIINYAIYKRVGFALNTNVEQLQSVTYNIGFYKTPRGTNHNFNYWISQHEFHKNSALLNTLLPGNQIPLINTTIPISLIIQRMIFDTWAGRRNNSHWRPKLRYEIGTPFTQNDIEEFVIFTELVYIELLNIA